MLPPQAFHAGSMMAGARDSLPQGQHPLRLLGPLDTPQLPGMPVLVGRLPLWGHAQRLPIQASLQRVTQALPVMLQQHPLIQVLRLAAMAAI